MSGRTLERRRKDIGETLEGCREGYLTVYAALSLAVLLSLFMALLEGVRFNTLQLEARLVADTAADSVLAEYHRELLERYGMFWIDTSYGEGDASVYGLEKRAEWYAEKNCDMGDVLFGSFWYRDFLAMEPKGVTVLEIGAAGDHGGLYFRQQAAEAVKSDIGIGFLEQISGWLEVVEEQGFLQSSLEEQREQVDRQIQELNGKKVSLGGKEIVIEAENPTLSMEEVAQAGILSLVLGDAGSVSDKKTDLTGLFDYRRRQGDILQGNWPVQEAEDLIQRLLWQEYLMRHCGFYGHEPEEGVLHYQLEYLIGGADSDAANLTEVVVQIGAIRDAANALYLFTDREKCAEAEAAAALISTVITLPELQPLFKTAILLGWAYAESLYDVRCLLAGDRVPLIKTADTWHYSIGGVLKGMQPSVSENDREASASSGLTYADYLRLLLLTAPLEEQTFRMMNVVEMEIRQCTGNNDFCMDGCVDRLTAEILIGSSYGYEVKVRSSKKY